MLVLMLMHRVACEDQSEGQGRLRGAPQQLLSFPPHRHLCVWRQHLIACWQRPAQPMCYDVVQRGGRYVGQRLARQEGAVRRDQRL